MTCLVLSFVLLPIVAQEPRKPIPDAASQQEAMKLIREVFKDEYLKRGAADRQALAAKLIQQAVETKEDPAARYVLLEEARALATEAGDTMTAVRAVEVLAAGYEVDRLALKYSTLSTGGKTSEQLIGSCELLLTLVDEAISAQDLTLAERAASAAVAKARAAKNIALLAKSDARSKDVSNLKSILLASQKAKETLAAQPDDPEANLALGRYLCLTQGDWVGGLPLLKKGSDATLKALATGDLGGAADSTGQVARGDGWWDLGETETGVAKDALRRRAAYWYVQAASTLKGLTLVKVEKRLREVGPSAPNALPFTLIEFRSADALNSFALSGGTWKIEGGELIGTCPGDRQWATFKTSFATISEVRMKVRLISPSKTNLRLWIGPIHLIFNWELANQNHYRNETVNTSKSPHALTPGKEHEIVLRQEGPKVILTVDGQIQYETQAKLAGTISIQAAHRSRIGLRQLRVNGIPDASRAVDAETRAIPPNS